MVKTVELPRVSGPGSGVGGLWRVVVLNDDFNTFEHVIDTLISVCKHSAEQAEQCTWIIHHKGKCTVKNGSLEELKPMREGIREKGIDARII